MVFILVSSSSKNWSIGVLVWMNCPVIPLACVSVVTVALRPSRIWWKPSLSYTREVRASSTLFLQPSGVRFAVRF